MSMNTANLTQSADFDEALRLMSTYRQAWRIVNEWKRARLGDELEPDEVRGAWDFIVSTFNDEVG